MVVGPGAGGAALSGGVGVVPSSGGHRAAQRCFHDTTAGNRRRLHRPVCIRRRVARSVAHQAGGRRERARDRDDVAGYRRARSERILRSYTTGAAQHRDGRRQTARASVAGTLPRANSTSRSAASRARAAGATNRRARGSVPGRSARRGHLARSVRGAQGKYGHAQGAAGGRITDGGAGGGARHHPRLPHRASAARNQNALDVQCHRRAAARARARCRLVGECAGADIDAAAAVTGIFQRGGVTAAGQPWRRVLATPFR
eukprot:ctg_2790.g394